MSNREHGNPIKHALHQDVKKVANFDHNEALQLGSLCKTTREMRQTLLHLFFPRLRVLHHSNHDCMDMKTCRELQTSNNLRIRHSQLTSNTNSCLQLTQKALHNNWKHSIQHLTLNRKNHMNELIVPITRPHHSKSFLRFRT